MAAKNGNGHAHDEERQDPREARQQMQINTLRGDVRDQVLRLVRELPDSWKKMTGSAQEDAISRIERFASSLVDEAVEIVASRGCDFQVVRLGKISADKGVIDCKFTTPYTHEAMTTLCSRQGQEVALVARDVDQFKGERDRAEADNIGDLAIPRGRTLSQALAASSGDE
jgi:hypothetical protein